MHKQRKVATVAQARASWKGYLKLSEISCPVALYAAISSSERIFLHTVDRETGHRLRREFVDSMTGETVEREDQVKGYEVANGEFVVLEPEEIKSAVPHNDKTISVSAFVDRSEIDDVYLDRPYYVAPADETATEAFSLIREGLRASATVAVASAVLFRRARTLLISPYGQGLAAVTLNFDYEVRQAREAFAEIPDIEIKGEMLDLAAHIIETKRGDFDPATFHDRYEGALAELVKAKIEGRTVAPPRRAAPKPPSDLLAALRESVGVGGKGAPARRPAKASQKRASPRRKAG